MELNIENKENVIIVTFAGRLDTASAQNITEQIKESVVDFGGKPVVIDCSTLEYISSSGIRLMLFIRKAATQVTLKGVHPEIMQIIKVTKLDSMFTFE